MVLTFEIATFSTRPTILGRGTINERCWYVHGPRVMAGLGRPYAPCVSQIDSELPYPRANNTLSYYKNFYTSFLRMMSLRLLANMLKVVVFVLDMSFYASCIAHGRRTYVDHINT